MSLGWEGPPLLSGDIEEFWALCLIYLFSSSNSDIFSINVFLRSASGLLKSSSPVRLKDISMFYLVWLCLTGEMRFEDARLERGLLGEFSLTVAKVSGFSDAALFKLALVVIPSLICPSDSILIWWGSMSVSVWPSLNLSFLTMWK